MKNNFNKVYKRSLKLLQKFYSRVKDYFKHNILFITYISVCLIDACLLRFFTVKNYTAISPVLADFTIIVFVGAFGYLLKQKNRFKYYMTCLIPWKMYGANVSILHG